MLHELVHNVRGPHDSAFYKLLDEITAECEELMARGVGGTGVGFDGPSSGRLGSHAFIPLHNPDPGRLRDYALKAAEERAKRQRIMPSGPRRLGHGEGDGGHVQRYATPAEAAAKAAERRCRDNRWCPCERLAGAVHRAVAQAQAEADQARAQQSGQGSAALAADSHGAAGVSSANRGNSGPGSASPFGPSADAASGFGFRQLTAAEVESDLIRRIEEGVIDLTLDSDSDSDLELDGAAVAPQLQGGLQGGRGHGGRMRSESQSCQLGPSVGFATTGTGCSGGGDGGNGAAAAAVPKKLGNAAVVMVGVPQRDDLSTGARSGSFPVGVGFGGTGGVRDSLGITNVGAAATHSQNLAVKREWQGCGADDSDEKQRQEARNLRYGEDGGVGGGGSGGRSAGVSRDISAGRAGISTAAAAAAAAGRCGRTVDLRQDGPRPVSAVSAQVPDIPAEAPASGPITSAGASSCRGCPGPSPQVLQPRNPVAAAAATAALARMQVKAAIPSVQMHRPAPPPRSLLPHPQQQPHQRHRRDQQQLLPREMPAQSRAENPCRRDVGVTASTASVLPNGATTGSGVGTVSPAAAAGCCDDFIDLTED
ncbi:hypothetical protein Vafri_1756 [Volvox africanus]|nr:hypothetical protein Vafri_1756 [Volvox africanus]